MRRTFLSQLQVTPSAYGSVFSAVVHLGQAARSDIDSWIVASLDRKRLGQTFGAKRISNRGVFFNRYRFKAS